MNRSTVAIAGGGIAGLTAALCLEREGFRVLIFERNDGPTPFGAGIQLSPNAFKVLASLGLDAPLRAAGSFVDGVDLHNGLNGKFLSRFDMGDALVKRHGAPYIVLHRADLAQILSSACEQSDRIEMRYGCSVTGLEMPSTKVIVEEENRSEAIKADAVIGADGVWSELRKHVPKAEVPHFTGRVAWRALLPMESVDPGISRSSTGVWLGPKAHVVHYPVRGGEQLNVVAITPSGDTANNPPRRWLAEDQTQKRLATFSGWNQRVQSLVATDGNWGGWPLYRVKQMQACASGPLTLIGDAAHASEPYAAQGGACAIEDAAVLARQFSRFPNDLAKAGSHYESIRKDRVNKILNLAQSNRRIYHLPYPATLARDFGMKIAPQESLQRRMDWLYGWEMG